MNCPRVLALVGNYDIAAWWRVLWPFAELQRRGCPVEFAEHGDLATMERAADFDIVMLMRIAVTEPYRDEARQWVERWHRGGATVIFESDDDLFSGAADEQLNASPGHPAQWTISNRADYLFALRLCDGVTVSTEHLASVARRFTDAPVHVVPNAIDLPWYRERQGRRSIKGLTIGWFGGVRPDADLEPMAIAWGRIAARYPDVRFVVQGHHPEVIAQHVPEERIIRLPWLPLENHPSALHNVDIGCCALASTEFNRSKSANKAIEYAVSGAAVVASPTVYGDFLLAGPEGLIAESPDAWETALALLIEDAPMRKRMAGKLARRVAREHTLAACWQNWPAAWNAILAQVDAARDAEVVAFV